MGYGSLDIQAETAALGTPTDHSAVGHNEGHPSLRNDTSWQERGREETGDREEKRTSKERQTQSRKICQRERRPRTNGD